MRKAKQILGKEDVRNTVKNKLRYSVLEDFESLYCDGFDTGYKRGFDEGARQTLNPYVGDVEERAYTKGLEEAWELARKIILVGKECFSSVEVSEIYGEALSSRVLDEYTAQDALSVYREWKENQEQDSKQEKPSPCDVCRFNPPSSGDGKPCTMCPAESEG
jgi:hypothetical protein